MSRAGLRVEVAGPRALLQDLGRPGQSGLGVGRSGAADRGALRLANRLVANDEAAAGIEVTMGGLRVRALRDLTVAVTGPPAPVRVSGRPVGSHAPITVRRDQTLELGIPAEGLRNYVAVRGGIVAPTLFGSVSTDTMSGIGPPPLSTGDELAVGDAPTDQPVVDVAPIAPPGPARLRVLLGPRDDWFTDPSVLGDGRWQVSDDSDRVGLRLVRPGGDGALLRRSDNAELPSEGVVRGALQVPRGGEPVLFLADHPVTGGYPVVGVVLDADCDRAAQLRPGDPVSFRLVTASMR